jgi:hypothetical protein
MKKLITSFIFFLLVVFADATGIVLFSDNFANNSAWNITSGQLIVSNNIASTEGNSASTEAYANFSQPLGAGHILQLTFKSNDVSNFATNGWAGLSLYVAGSEEIFIGSPGNMSSWGLDGPSMGSPVPLTTTSEIAEVKFTYNYNTGAWTINVAGETASGTIASGLAFDQIRIGADVSNLADIAISNLNVVTNSGTDTRSECPPYTWLNGNSYSASTFTAVHVLTGQGAGGSDSIVTLNLTIYPQLQYGSGTSTDPYLITSKADLKILSENQCYWNTGSYFAQTTDIIFTAADFQVGGDFYNGGSGFSPIGNSTTNFTGSYNGQGHLIQNLVISDPASVSYVGFFGSVGNTAVIQKLGLENAQVSGTYANGILCGTNSGTVSECFSSGLVSDNYYAGGLIGSNTGTVTNCYSTAAITNTIFRLQNPNHNAKSTLASNQQQGSGGKGGLIGYTCANISKCYSTGNLSGVTSPAGGLIGDGCPVFVTKCFWDTQTSAMATSDGGTGKTTVLMQTQSTFTDSLWDFVGETVNGTNDIWKMGGCSNSGYPVFAWQAVLSAPVVDSVADAIACDSIQLAPLNVGNYFYNDNGNETPLFAGDFVDSSQTLYVYAANGACTDLDSFVVTIIASPDITASVNAETITSNATGTSYQWIDCNNGNAVIAGETNQSFTASANGNYAVIIDNGNCADTSACAAITTVGLNESNLSGVSVYPNPTRGKIVVTLQRTETVSIALKNVLGQVIESKTSTNSKQVELTVDEAPGVYFLEITNVKNKRTIVRIVKE